MKLDPSTVSVLKSFSAVNQTLAFHEGNILSTISPKKAVIAQATLKDNFPTDAAVGNLPRLLGTLNKTSDLIFKDGYFEINTDNPLFPDKPISSVYKFTNPSHVDTPPPNTIVLPTKDANFDLKAISIEGAISAENAMSIPQISNNKKKDYNTQLA